MLQCACEVTEQLPVSVFEAEFLVAGASPASLGASGDSPGSSLHLALQTSGLHTSFRVLLMVGSGGGVQTQILVLAMVRAFPPKPSP